MLRALGTPGFGVQLAAGMKTRRLISGSILKKEYDKKQAENKNCCNGKDDEFGHRGTSS